MKKNIVKGLVFLGLMVALVLTSCKNDVPESEFLYDVEPDASEVTVKAYPGFNYVTWTYVDDDSTIYVYRDDGTDITPSSGEYFYIDTDIQDGATYKYTTYTVFNNNPVNFQYEGTDITDNPNGTPAWKLSAAKSSASCTAINPSYIKDNGMMTALELCDYEKEGNSKYVINEKNIVMNINEGCFQVAWPTKNYLNYKAYLIPSANIETFGLEQAIANSGEELTDTSKGYALGTQYDNTLQLFYTNNGTFKVRTPITAAGKYKVAVKVSAVNDTMYDTVTVLSKNEFNIEALDVVTNTSVLEADYIDEGKTIRIIWNPAVKKDTTTWGAESYTVYAKDGINAYTAISTVETIKTDTHENETVLYCDYEVPNNKVGYTFEVVLSENGKYEAASSGTSFTAMTNKYRELPELSVSTDASLGYLVKDAATTPATIATFDYVITDLLYPTTDVYNDVALYFNNCAKGFTVKSVKYKTISKSGNGSYPSFDKHIDSEMITAAVTPSADYTQYSVYVKDVAENNEVVFLIQMGYEGYKDLYYIVTTDAIDLSISIDADPTTGEFRVAKDSTTAANAASVYNVTVYAGDIVNNSNYTYKLFKTKLDKYGYADENCKWEEVPVTIAKNASSYYEGTAKVTFDPTTVSSSDLAGTPIEWTDYYAFKFVKTNKHSGATAFEYYGPIEVKKTK